MRYEKHGPMYTVISDDGLHIARVGARDDAQLFAAAPDMLAALEECSDLLEGWWQAAGSPDHATEAALWEARAAIAKARGTTP